MSQTPGNFNYFGPELNVVKQYFVEQEKALNAALEKLKLPPGQSRGFPELYDYLLRQKTQAGIAQAAIETATPTPAVALDETFVTVNNEPTLANSRAITVSSPITLIDSGPQGDITIGATQGLDIPRPNFRSWIYAPFTGTVASSMPFPGFTLALTGSGANLAPTATLPAAIKLTTDGVINHTAGFAFASTQWRVGRNLQFQCGLWPSTLLTNERIFFGVTDFGASMLTSDTPNCNYAGFLFSTVRGDTNWQGAVGNSSAHQTLLDTGVAVVLNTYHSFEFISIDGTPLIAFYIDGAHIGNVTTNLPTSGTNVGFEMQIVSTAAASNAIASSHVYLEYDQ